MDPLRPQIRHLENRRISGATKFFTINKLNPKCAHLEWKSLTFGRLGKGREILKIEKNRGVVKIPSKNTEGRPPKAFREIRKKNYLKANLEKNPKAPKKQVGEKK